MIWRGFVAINNSVGSRDKMGFSVLISCIASGHADHGTKSHCEVKWSG